MRGEIFCRGCSRTLILRACDARARVFAECVAGRAYCFALRGLVLDATSWRAPRSGGRRAPKGLMPFGNPQREKVAPLSLCSFFREGVHIQILRCRLKGKRQHESVTQATTANTFSTCDALLFAQILNKNEIANILALSVCL